MCIRDRKYATGVYTSGVVFEPHFYEGFADMLQNNELPIFNWIWFGLYRDETGVNGYTYGMDVFGKDEMEVLGTDAEPGDLRDFLASLVSYVLENDVELHDGETIGFTAEDVYKRQDWERWILLVRENLMNITGEEAEFLRSILGWLETTLSYTDVIVVEGNL